MHTLYITWCHMLIISRASGRYHATFPCVAWKNRMLSYRINLRCHIPWHCWSLWCDLLPCSLTGAEPDRVLLCQCTAASQQRKESCGTELLDANYCWHTDSHFVFCQGLSMKRILWYWVAICSDQWRLTETPSNFKFGEAFPRKFLDWLSKFACSFS